MKTKRNLWPYGIIAAFVLFASGLTTFIVIAETHPEKMVSENYYEQELKFQGQIDDAARARAAGAAVRYDPAAGRISIALPAGQVTPQLAGKIGFYRAAAPDLDREYPLAPGPDGTQTLDATALAAGPWTLHVAWQVAGLEYYLEQKIVVPAK